MNRPRLILADDHRIVAEGLKSLLIEEFDLVAIVEDGVALVEEARRLRPDVIVSDVTMPRLNGIEALPHLRNDNPSIKVVFLTMHQDVAYARRALDAGGSAFILKHAAPAELVMAIRAALKGKTFISPAIAGDLMTAIKKDPLAAKDPVKMLTPRQRQILQSFAEGRSAKEIGGALGISARTVEFHKYRMMESLGMQNSADLMRFAITQGMVGGQNRRVI